MIYFDSSYIAKFYLDEPDSNAVRVRAEAEGEVCCSVLGRAEVVSVFHRKWREKTRTKPEFSILLDQFEADCVADLWTWLPSSSAVVRAVVAKFRSLPDTTFLRSADAIHLATAAESGLPSIFSKDRHLLAAAPHFGLIGEIVS